MADRVYNKYTFKEINGEVVRVPNDITQIPTRPLMGYQSVNGTYFYGGSRTPYSTEQLMASGVITSGMDWYMFGNQLAKAGIESGLSHKIKTYIPNSQIMTYAGDLSLSVFNFWYQADSDLNRRNTEFFDDNEIEIKYDLNTQSTANWRRYRAKCTYSIVSGTVDPDPGTKMVIYPNPNKWAYYASNGYDDPELLVPNNTGPPTYSGYQMWPSGVGLNWRWVSKKPINNGITLSGTLWYDHGEPFGTLRWESGDYFPPTSGLWPWAEVTTHGDLSCYWGGTQMKRADPVSSGYVYGSGLYWYEKIFNGTYDPYYNEVDFFMLDGPVGMFNQDNRANPLGLVPSQTIADDPFHFGFNFADNYYFKYIGYIDFLGTYDPNDIDNTTFYGELCRRGNFNDAQASELNIRQRNIKNIWNARFPNAMFFNGVDVDSVIDDPNYISNFGTADFRDRNDFIYDESPFRHVGGWDNWWKWTPTLRGSITYDLWYYVNRYRPKNSPKYVFFDMMSSDSPTVGEYPEFGEHFHSQGYYGHAICLLTDNIFNPGRYNIRSEEFFSGNPLGGLPSSFWAETQLADRGFFRKYEIGDPIEDPHLDEDNVIRREFTNGYVHMDNAGADIRDAHQIYHTTRIKTYQLRDFDIPSLWGAWISDENVMIGSGLGRYIPTVDYWEPELGNNAPIFSGVDNNYNIPTYADLGCWYPSLSFTNAGPSGVLTAGPQDLSSWNEFTMYVYAKVNTVPTENSKRSIVTQRSDGLLKGSFNFYQWTLATNQIAVQFYTNGGNRNLTTTNGLDRWALYTIQYQPNDLRLYTDFTLEDSDVTLTNNLVDSTTNELTVGGVYDGSIAASGIDGKLGAVIICSGFHDDITRLTIQSGLIERYTRQF